MKNIKVIKNYKKKIVKKIVWTEQYQISPKNYLSADTASVIVFSSASRPYLSTSALFFSSHEQKLMILAIVLFPLLCGPMMTLILLSSMSTHLIGPIFFNMNRRISVL